jgi:hypothetical protein
LFDLNKLKSLNGFIKNCAKLIREIVIDKFQIVSENEPRGLPINSLHHSPIDPITSLLVTRKASEGFSKRKSSKDLMKITQGF